MDFIFYNKTITGMLTVMPNKAIFFEDEMRNFNFSEKSSLRLATQIGLHSRRVVESAREKENTTASDLCVFGINYMLEHNLLKKEDIAALVFVSQTPDYIQPATSNVIQGKIGLNNDVVCIDINQGCAGFILGLFECFLLLNVIPAKKILLLNAETPSLVMPSKDRSSTPLFGDAAVITIVENTSLESKILLKIKNDGKRYDSLYIPAGGFKLRSSDETRKEEIQSDGNFRSLEHPRMKGDDVYNFTVNEVVNLINETAEDSWLSKNEIDYFMLHQPNRFILRQMAKKIDVSEEKMPNNIVPLFGNSSGAALPVNIVYNLGDILESRELNLLMCGFGIGLAWNTAIMKMGNMKFCKMIGHPVV
jgi:3-oxoacyl-[acyl-carrier-protein] synthase-3